MITETLFPVYRYQHLDKYYHVLVISILNDNNKDIVICSFVENNTYIIQEKYNVEKCTINFIYTSELISSYEFIGLYSELKLNPIENNNINVPVYKCTEYGNQVIIVSLINNNVLLALTNNYTNDIEKSYDINNMYLRLVNKLDMNKYLFLNFSKWYN